MKEANPAVARAPAGARRTARALLQLLAWLLALAVLTPDASAQVTRAFSVRYFNNFNGNVKLIGNMVMTCGTTGPFAGGATAANCATAQQAGFASGNALNNNNDYTSIYVDADADPTTFNSSSSVLNIPAGVTVLFAGLYWGAESASAQRGTMLLKTPAGSGYNLVNASQLDIGPVGQVTNTYGAFADVTALVNGGGAGTYWGANVQGTINQDEYAGWGLVVVYQDNTQPLRNVTVFDGFATVSSAATAITVTPSGFLTPLSGPVVAKIGSITYEGDLGFTGDSLIVNGTTIADAANPADNYFNSSASDGGVTVTTNNPNFQNMMSFDIDNSNIPAGVIANGATSAKITYTSTNDTFYPQVIVFSTTLYVPIITPNLTKTATNLNGGPLLPGDVIRWTMSMNNTGQDTGINLVLNDPIPANTTYKAGSLNIISGANAGVKTDAAGDDQAEKTGTLTNAAPVVFRLGTGANTTQGGQLPFGASTSLSFDTTLNMAVSAGTQISNTANISYNGQTLFTTNFSSSSSAATLTVLGPPTISKSFNAPNIAAGASSQLSIIVTNPATNPATLTGVVVADTYPAGLVNSTVTAPNPQVVCTPGSSAGTITGGTAGGNTIGMNPGANIAANGTCTITVNVSGPAGTYVNTTSPVTSSNAGPGGSASATLAIGKISIAKAFGTSPVNAGSNSLMTLTLANNSGAAATGVAFTDTYPAGLQNNSGGAVVSNTCGGAPVVSANATNPGTLSLTGGTMAIGATCTITVNVQSATGGIYNNTTSGVTRTGDAVAGNPSNTASVTVVAAPTIVKSFSPTAIRTTANGGVSTLMIVITNPNTITVTAAGTAFTDTYPANLTNSNPRTVSLNCSTGSSATLVGGAAGGNTLGMSALTLLPGGSCTLTSAVNSTVVAAYPNTVTAPVYDNAPSANSNTATLTVTNNVAPVITKTFSAPSIGVGGTATMTITIRNPNGGTINNVAFTDNYPTYLFNSATPAPAATASCGATPPSLTATAGGNSLVVGATTGATIASGATCTITVQITSSVPGTLVNNSGSVTSSNAPPGTAVTGSIDVAAAPTITKTFSPTSVGIGANSLMTITLTNPPTNTVALAGLGFTDTYPVGLQNNSGGAVISNSCGGTTTASANATNPGTLTLNNNAPLAVGATCTITINVQSATGGFYTNTTGQATSTTTGANTGPGGVASATLNVGKLGITKSFNPSTIPSNGTSTVTFLITNGAGVAATGLAFTDALSNMQMANGAVGGSCNGVTSNAAAGVTSFAVTAGNVPPAGCTITITVTSSTSGVLPNTTSGATRTGDAVAGAPSNTANLTVTPPPTITKSFAPTSMATGASTLMTLSIFNSNSTPATGGALTDNYPANLVNAAPPAVTNGCGGTVTAAAGTGSLTLTGATLPANTICNITVNVSSTVPGSYTNTIPVGGLNSGLGQNAAATSATVQVMQPASVTKSFTPGAMAAGASSQLVLTLTNPNAIAVTGGALVDNYPGGLVNATPAGASTSCPAGTLTAANGGTSLQLSGMTIPASGSCTVSVFVTAAANGTYVNTIAAGALTTSNAGPSATGTTASLAVGRPLIAKIFSPNPILPNAASTLTFTLTNPVTSGAMTAATFQDIFPTVPGPMVVANPPNASTTCAGGSVVNIPGGTAVAAGNTGVQLNGGTIPAGGNCTVSVSVTATNSGTYNNVTVANSYTTNAGTGNNANASLVVMAAPTVTKNFTPAIVGINQPSVLTITLSNPNASAIAGAGFTDTYSPAAITNSASPGGATSCPGGSVVAANNGPSVALTGATIPAGGSCTVTVNVVGTAAGGQTNTIAVGAVTAPGSAPPSAVAASAILTVLTAPTVAKAFATNPINPGATSAMTITLTNPNATNAITGSGLVDTYPSGLLNAAAPAVATTCAGGTATAIGGGNSVSLTGATIPAAGSCTVTVTVTAASGGSYLNNTGPLTTANAGTGAAATATLNVNIPPGALANAKSFSPNNIAAGGTSTLTITIANPNAFAVTGVTFTDTYPANLVNTGAAAVLNCGLAATQSAVGVNPGTLTLTNQTIPASTTCTITIAVKGVTALTQGSFNNCVPAFTPGNAPVSAQACGILNIGSAIVPPPTISKSFSPNPIAPGGNSTLTFTLTNVSTSGATVLAFTDTYPAGLTNNNPDATTNTCGGTLAGPGGAGVPDGNTGISLPAATPGTLAASSSCTITTQVTAASAGAYNNTSGAVSATINAATRTGNTASAALTVSNPALIAKSFLPTTITAGLTSTITFTLTNPTAVAMAAASFSDTLTNMAISATAAAGGSCTGASGNNFTAGATGAINFTGLTIAASSSCTVTVVVTSSTPGGLPNASSGVTSGGVTGSPSNTATLTVNAGAPSITKAFAPATIAAGANTTMTLTITNPNAVALSGLAFTDGMTNMTLATVPAVGGTCTGVTTTSAGGSTSFTVTAGNVPASSSCTITVQVTGNVVGTWPNVTSGVTTTQTPTAGSQSNTANLTVLSNGVPVSGFVYNDANANGTLDNSETWAAGTSVFVNIVSGGAVVQSIAVGAGSGAYSFSNVPIGNYTIVLTNSAINTVAVAPASWSFTGPTDGTIPISAGTTGSLSWNFGLRQGQRISGHVFRDTGVLGSPTLANNGIMDTNEAASNPQNPLLLPLGFGGVTVNIYANATCAGAPAATTTTDGGGNFVFAAAPAGAVCIQKVNPTGYVATGASVNTTALPSNVATPVGGTTYTYCRTASGCAQPVDTITFTAAANTSYTAINFGVVPSNTFAANMNLQGPPGTTVDFAHIYIPGSVGSVTFTSSRSSQPAIPGWSEVIYRDNNCNGVLDNTDAIIGGTPISVDPNDTSAGDPSQRRVCIIVREFIPPAAPSGAENKVTISAAYTYSNANPALPVNTLTVVDTTTVGSANGGDGLRLVKQVCNVTQTAAPGCVAALTGANAGNGFAATNTGASGDEIQYRITYSNASSTALTNLVVNDTTPPYTVRSATAAGSVSMPATLTGPTIVQPATGQAGAFSWTFGGSLAPTQQGVVTFNILIQ